MLAHSRRWNAPGNTTGYLVRIPVNAWHFAIAFWLTVTLAACGGGGEDPKETPTTPTIPSGGSSATTNGCSALSSSSAGAPMCGVLGTMGDQVADQVMNVEVSLQRAFWGGIPVNIVYPLNDCSAKSGNAMADPSTRNIFFGVYLFNNLVQKNGNVLPVAGVLAHEWGHQIQFAFGWETSPVRRMELEADAFSGYFMALAKGWAWAYMSSYFQTVFDTGDFNFNDPGHHGTPNQRYAAARLGFDTAVQASAIGRPLSYIELHSIFTSSIALLEGQTVTASLSIDERKIVDSVVNGEAKKILLGAKGRDAGAPGDATSRRRLWPR